MILALRLFVLAACCLAAPALALAAETPASPSPAPTAKPTAGPSLSWRSIGPAVSGGRVTSVMGSDLDPSLFFAGAAGGGLWQSTNGGTDFRSVTIPGASQSIGAIAIAPKDVKNVWVGTGEGWPRNDVIAGNGIFHSRDGGKTWNAAGLAKTSQIVRILIDPRDARHVIVAALGDPFKDSAERGVFATRDGGATWQSVLALSPSTGASDVAFDPANPDTLYAGMWDFRRSAWQLRSGGPTGGLYRSTDGGTTWTKLTGNGLPSGGTGRIAVAIAPSDPKRIYALIESPEGLLWRSDDGGTTWAKTSSNTLINERPFYYSRIAVDPHDRDHLFSVSVKLAESNTGGKTWHLSGRSIHGDHHDVWFANDGRTIYEGNDGGAVVSRDNGKTWDWRNVMPVSQFYHISVSAGRDYTICGGLQDNGSWCAPSDSHDALGILPNHWMSVSGGDGTWTAQDPSDPTEIFSSNGGGDNQGELTRYSTRTGQITDVSVYKRNQNVTPVRDLAYRFNWESPIVFSPRDAHVAYYGGNVLFRSTDRGMTWTQVSPDLTRNVRERQGLSGGPVTLDVTGAETFDTLLDVAPSPLDARTIWTASDDGLVHLTRDAGAHWSNLAVSGVDIDTRLPTIEASHANPARAYLVGDRHYVGDNKPYVFVTDDYGAHWRSIANNLRGDAFVRVVREDPKNANILYIGGEDGVQWSRDRGLTWEKFPADLPPVSVRDLRVQPEANDLVAATHGRGIYVFDDLRPLQERANGVALFTPRDTIVFERRSTTVNAKVPGANPAGPALISFTQDAPATQTPAIEILDSHGTVVRHISGAHPVDGADEPLVPNRTGLNRVAWDGTSDAPTPWRRAPAWESGPENGTPVPSGTYTIVLHRDGLTKRATFKLINDPRMVGSPASERAGIAMMASLTAELSSIDDALNVLDNLKLQLPERVTTLKQSPANDAIVARSTALLAKIDTVVHTLTSSPINDQDNDFLQDLLRERIMSLMGSASIATPPQAQVIEARALAREYDTAMAGYRAFITAEVTPLAQSLGGAGLALDLNARPKTVPIDPNADEHARRREE